MKTFLKWIFPIVFSGTMLGQNYTRFNGDSITLNNGIIKRTFSFSDNRWNTARFGILEGKDTLIGRSEDFSFLLDDELITGNSSWEFKNQKSLNTKDGGYGFSVTLQQKINSPTIEVTLFYVMYPNLPITRKWMNIKNISSREIKIEGMVIESLNTTLEATSSWVYQNYARMKHLMKYIGDWDDALVVVHDMGKQKGIALGNETIGVLKRTAFHTEKNNIEIGLTQPDQDYAFRKWLKPNEKWEIPKVFIGLYNNRNDGFDIVNNEINYFIKKHMKPRVLNMEEKPTFIYNTWYPFRTHINDSLIRSVAKAAAECGIEEFVIDDGWQVNSHRQSSIRGWGENYGDWLVDKNKFPDGLKPVFDYIKSLGMKPGLWISIGSATKDSKVFQEHPEWFVRNEEGAIGNLHFDSKEDQGFYTASFGTPWKNYIKGILLGLVKDYGLAYAKLDLAVVCSPYVNNESIAGSYAENHPKYKDQPESLIVLYDELISFFDELHKEAPDLFIDCTFETAGKLHMMDYALAKNAEGNWLSNFEEASPVGALRVRQMAWWRSPALPASSLVIGNLPMDDPDFMFGFKSLIGTVPIVLGDPRKIWSEKKELIHKWAIWLKAMQKKHDYMSYRKDLKGFGEPNEGMWDGWQRINFQTKSGGIFGVFKQGALESDRQVFLTELNPKDTYEIREAVSEKIVLKEKGEFLMKNGIKIEIPKPYGGKIFEVTKASTP
ncbi:alpha-galactosidase [Galbibacter sp. BG1]|uniref:glycoside hydrolase family 36 protein n=1 Tax=Galbibacter sp. BG1 TaxID=1170699 RepID=UPI0015B7EE21|nr:glycoside hydrolase family 36 protein [Galbibacter sp. BG1]QLE01821.1 alpha-galactosidase [Galbibacter sp. BG1]